MKDLVVDIWGEDAIKVVSSKILRESTGQTSVTSCDTPILNYNDLILVSDEGAKSIVLHFKPHEPKVKSLGWKESWDTKKELWRGFNRFVIQLLKKHEREFSTEVIIDMSRMNTNEFRARYIALTGSESGFEICQGHVNQVLKEYYGLKGIVFNKKDMTYEQMVDRDKMEIAYSLHLTVAKDNSKSTAYNYTRVQFGLKAKKELIVTV